MREQLRAGVAIYNAGEYHAAHDAWEDRWLDLERGSDDERLLHGLIQFTAVLHHARACNWTGLSGLVDGAREYLADLPADYRGVNVGDVRPYLDALQADPEHVERAAPPPLTHEGVTLDPGDLSFEAAAVAAEVLAEEFGYEEEPVEQAIAYAREDLAADEGTSTFVVLVMDFAAESDHRSVVYERLRRHVQRRAARDADVEGLFDAEE